MVKAKLVALSERPRGTRACCTPRAQTLDRRAEQTSDDLGLLANPIRLRLLHILLDNAEPVCVCDLMSALGLKQATVSHHLKLLKLGALVDFEKRGVWSFWSVRRGGLSALKQRLSAALESLA